MTTRHLLFGLVIALSVPACRVDGTARVHAGATVVYQEPPQPQVEKVNERSGFLWVKGHWDWQNGQWAWIGGHWEPERTGSQWREGRWERRGSSWHWVPGEWIAGSVVVGGGAVGGGGGQVSEYPDREPPAPQVENYDPRPGHVWIAGRWEWKGGKWAWSAGRWESARDEEDWKPGRWERQGARWVWVEGTWEQRPYDGPTSEPPAIKPERPAPKRGQVWIAGRWEWKGGRWEWTAGRYEAVRPKEVWTPGRWEQKGRRWVWVDGSWGVAGGGGVSISVEYPDRDPPAAKDDSKPYKPGFVWVKGRWAWKAGKWEWTEGRYEKTQDKKKWVDGKWDKQGGKWVWVEGSWQ